MRRFAIVALCALLAFSLFGCGERTEEPQSDTGPEAVAEDSPVVRADKVILIYFGSPG